MDLVTAPGGKTVWTWGTTVELMIPPFWLTTDVSCRMRVTIAKYLGKSEVMMRVMRRWYNSSALSRSKTKLDDMRENCRTNVPRVLPKTHGNCRNYCEAKPSQTQSHQPIQTTNDYFCLSFVVRGLPSPSLVSLFFGHSHSAPIQRRLCVFNTKSI